MRSHHLLIALTAATGAMAASAQGDPMAALRKAETTVSKPILVERYGADDLRLGELRLPKGKGPFPLAVVIHGGCWSADVDTLKGTGPLADALTARGIATWNIEYRRIGNPGGGYPGTFEDIAAGVDHIRMLAKTQPIDLKRVIIVGHSSGGHLALWAASRSTLDGALGGTKAFKPAAVVAIDGPGMLAPLIGLDKQACNGRSVIVPLMGGTPVDKPDAYHMATPIEHLPFGMRQLLVEADFQPIMAPYADAAKAAGDPVEVLVPADANHFDIITPASANGAKVVDFIVARALVNGK